MGVAVRAFMPSFLYSKAHVAGTFFPLSIALGVKIGVILVRVTAFMGPWGVKVRSGMYEFWRGLGKLVFWVPCMLAWWGPLSLSNCDARWEH